MTQVDDATRRRNRRTAWVLGLIALGLLLASVPFWQNLVQVATAPR